MTDNTRKVFQWLAMSWTFNVRATQCLKINDFPGVAVNCQQAVEFSAKAILVAFGISPKRTHNPSEQLMLLLKKETDEELIQEIIDIVASLAEEYLLARNPDEESPFVLYDSNEANELQEIIKKGLKHCATIITKRLNLSKENLINKVISEVVDESLKQIVEEEISRILIVF
ncbi:MAG: HEPN domain-containing protein [Candidatus Hodarchaeales archaeon]|jgi:HEPN domain-containing protein